MCVIKKGAYSLFCFCFGGIGYSFIEVLWRGFTHWSMFLLGGFCYLLMGILAEQCCGRLPLWFCCFFSTLSITFLEFITGCVVNLGLGWDVWNYADQPTESNGTGLPGIYLPVVFTEHPSQRAGFLDAKKS